MGRAFKGVVGLKGEGVNLEGKEEAGGEVLGGVVMMNWVGATGALGEEGLGEEGLGGEEEEEGGGVNLARFSAGGSAGSERKEGLVKGKRGGGEEK